MTEKLIVVGAGPMGLGAAYHALKRGYSVDVLEADDRIGGMAAHIDFGGLSIERFYHFSCTGDHATFEMLNELGLSHAMKWVSTTMGYFIGGKLHDWGDPISLFKFPELNLFQKIRYGLLAFTATKRSDWAALDQLSAKDWFIKWCGADTYNKMWRPLLALKFYEFADDVSAAWVWQRIKRLGLSRKSLFEERLGYVDGGSETLINALAASIQATGGRIHLQTPARQIHLERGRVAGIEAGDGAFIAAPNIISTVPIPVAARLLDQLPLEISSKYKAIESIGCVCVMLKLAKRVSQHFWVNLSHPEARIPGFVEFSNLRPMEGHLVYAPFYMPRTNEMFSRPDSTFVDDAFRSLCLVNPNLTRNDILQTHVGRLSHAQPVCNVDFANKIPPRMPMRGLVIADTSYYYPEDRGMSESLRFAKILVDDLAERSSP